MKKLAILLALLMSCATVPVSHGATDLLREPKDPTDSATSQLMLLFQRPEALPIVGDHTILFEDGIDSGSVQSLELALDKLAEDRPKEIQIVIDSTGGSILAGMRMAKLIERYPAQVTCTVDGLAASMAMAVLASCDHRQMTERSSLMGHAGSTAVEGQENQLRNGAEAIRVLSRQVAAQTVKSSRVSVDEFLEKTAGGLEWWLAPSEALDRGFVEKVVKTVEY